MRNIGIILTAAWLILTGIGQVGLYTVPSVPMGILAVFAGAFLILGR